MRRSARVIWGFPRTTLDKAVDATTEMVFKMVIPNVFGRVQVFYGLEVGSLGKKDWQVEGADLFHGCFLR